MAAGETSIFPAAVFINKLNKVLTNEYKSDIIYIRQQQYNNI